MVSKPLLKNPKDKKQIILEQEKKALKADLGLAKARLNFELDT